MTTQQLTILDVPGMSCSSCIHHVDQALGELEGVGQVQVDLRAGQVRVTHDAVMAPTDALLAALAEAGYEAKARSPGGATA